MVWVYIVLGTSIWVLIDSSTIGVKKGQIKGLLGMGPIGWFLSCLLIWIIAFPAYLAKRGELKRINGKDTPSTETNTPSKPLRSGRIMTSIVLIAILACLFRYGSISPCGILRKTYLEQLSQKDSSAAMTLSAMPEDAVDKAIAFILTTRKSYSLTPGQCSEFLLNDAARGSLTETRTISTATDAGGTSVANPQGAEDSSSEHAVPDSIDSANAPSIDKAQLESNAGFIDICTRGIEKGKHVGENEEQIACNAYFDSTVWHYSTATQKYQGKEMAYLLLNFLLFDMRDQNRSTATSDNIYKFLTAYENNMDEVTTKVDGKP